MGDEKEIGEIENRNWKIGISRMWQVEREKDNSETRRTQRFAEKSNPRAQPCVRVPQREFENRARKIGMHFARGFSFD